MGYYYIAGANRVIICEWVPTLEWNLSRYQVSCELALCLLHSTKKNNMDKMGVVIYETFCIQSTFDKSLNIKVTCKPTEKNFNVMGEYKNQNPYGYSDTLLW